MKRTHVSGPNPTSAHAARKMPAAILPAKPPANALEKTCMDDKLTRVFNVRNRVTVSMLEKRIRLTEADPNWIYALRAWCGRCILPRWDKGAAWLGSRGCWMGC